jgi:hypothetical protein
VHPAFGANQACRKSREVSYICSYFQNSHTRFEYALKKIHEFAFISPRPHQPLNPYIGSDENRDVSQRMALRLLNAQHAKD